MDKNSHELDFATLINDLRATVCINVSTSETFDKKAKIHKLLVALGDKVIPNMQKEVENIFMSNIQDMNYSLAFELCECMGKIGGEEAFQFLVKILKMESKFPYFDKIVNGAVLGLMYIEDDRCIDDLRAIKAKKPDFPLCSNVDRLIGTFEKASNMPENVISKGQKLTSKEAIEYFSNYQEKVSGWNERAKSLYYSVFAGKIQEAFGIDKALPFYAASLMANPDTDSVAWQYFKVKNKNKNKESAIKLSGKYPLPRHVNSLNEDIVVEKKLGFFRKLFK